MSLHPHPTYYTGQCLDFCHDDMHVDGDSCPTCNGYRTSCAACTPDHIKAKRHAEMMRAHQAPSTDAGTSHPAEATEAGAPGREVEPYSPATPSRPDATQRVTWDGPFAVEQDVQDDSWTVDIGLTEEGGRQHVRDLYHHRAMLISYFEVRQQAEDKRLDSRERDDAREIATALEHRLAGTFRSSSRPVAQWALTPLQAEQLLDDLEDANAEPDACAVGTCTANAIEGGSYCAPHSEVL